MVVISVECRRKGSLHYYLADMICMTGNHEISHVFGAVFFYPLKEIFACKIDNVESKVEKKKQTSFRIVENNSQNFSDNCLQIRSFRSHLLLQGLDTCHHFLDIHSHTSKERACKTDNIKLRG
jgi:hypothetical protein